MNMTFDAAKPQRGHIVAIRRNERIEAYQLRIGTGGVGQTRLFSCGKLGGMRKAWPRLVRRPRRSAWFSVALAAGPPPAAARG
jgi:hypothetical protein